MDIFIKSYTPADKEAWDRFVIDTQGSGFFHLSGWKEIIENAFGHKAHYILALEDEKIAGILPVFELKSRLFGHSLVSVPFTVYGGVCALNEHVEGLLFRSASTLGRLMGVDYVELRNQRRPLIEKKGWLIKDLYVTFQKEIYSDLDANFDAIPRKQRRMVRQGMKAGLISKVGGAEYLKGFYEIYARNKRYLGTPVFPLKFFENIMQAFPQTFILSVWKDNVMAAAVMTFVFKDMLMPYFSGDSKEYIKYAINDFMYWELMRYGCEKGFKVFDFGRSKKGTGSYDFKRHWGFEPTPLPYHYYLVNQKEMPNVSPVNPKYHAMINVWRRLPLSVANWLGPRLVRNIP